MIAQEDWDPGNIKVEISRGQAGEDIAQAIGTNNKELTGKCPANIAL